MISHLHQDHIGGLRELTHAEIIVGTAELESARAKLPEARGYLPDHIFVPTLTWNPLDTERDLFGDGTLVILPTPGHTPGSLSMLARQEGMTPLLFVGDLTYDVTLLEEGHVPGVGDKAGLEDSTRQVAELARQNPGLVVLAAHDPASAGMLAAAQAAPQLAS